VLGALWLLGRVQEAATSGAAAPRGDVSGTPRELAASYPVDVRVEPAHARLRLDRQTLSIGQLNTVLPRDGETHELRIAADGYVTTTVLFLDTAPPGNIRLEALPAAPAATLPVAAAAAPAPVPPSAAPPALPSDRSPSSEAAAGSPAAQSSTAGSPAAQSSTAVPRRRPRAAPRRRDASARDAAKPAPPASGASGEPRRPPGPQVQIIGGDTPKIQIID
jgi:hypothetical protein